MMIQESDQTMVVRDFVPGDAKLLSRLIVQNLRQVLIQDYPSEAIEALAPSFTPEKLVEDAASQLTLVGMLGADLVGTASLANDRVRSVFVDVTRHRAGIGRQLMMSLEADAKRRNLSSVYLMAGLSASGFYEKLGYRIVERVEHAIDGIPVPVIRMQKDLKPSKS
jgi:putative acetyltransferase